MTSTVLRVKRRLEETPQDALVLLCKKAKTESDSPELSPSLFVFQGTIKDEESVHTHVRNLWPKTHAKEIPASKNLTDILNKIRKERKDNSNESRYEIVNCIRGLKEEELVNDDDKDYALVDLARKTEEEAEDAKYAYDLYFSQKHDFDVSMLDNVVKHVISGCSQLANTEYLHRHNLVARIIHQQLALKYDLVGSEVPYYKYNPPPVLENSHRIEDYEADLIFGTCRDNGRKTPPSSEDSSDDSNDENNWRNEYPDTDKSSLDEDDMRQAMENCNIDDLSSDAGEDEIYDDSKLNKEDVLHYGSAYAKYKANVLSEDASAVEDKSNLVFCGEIKPKVKDLDEESIEGYKDEDDEGFYYGQEDTEQFVSQYRHDESESDGDRSE